MILKSPQLKRIISNNATLYFFVKLIRRIKYYYFPTISFYVKKLLRMNGIYKNIQVEKIRDFKNLHLGNRCFIVATGPSLRIEDVEKLSNEFTFGMNSICKLGNETSWQPTYYGIQDLHVYRKLNEEIKNLEKSKAIFIADAFPSSEKLRDDKIVEMPIFAKNHLVNPNADNIEFSSDCYSVIHDGYTITYSLIQLAVYMGFKEIYLLGADTSYAAKGPQHIVESGVFDPNFLIAGERMIRAYNTAKSFADENGVKIYNATRGGYLEVFPRVKFDDLELKGG